MAKKNVILVDASPSMMHKKGAGVPAMQAAYELAQEAVGRNSETYVFAYGLDQNKATLLFGPDSNESDISRNFLKAMNAVGQSSELGAALLDLNSQIGNYGEQNLTLVTDGDLFKPAKAQEALKGVLDGHPDSTINIVQAGIRASQLDDVVTDTADARIKNVKMGAAEDVFDLLMGAYTEHAQPKDKWQQMLSDQAKASELDKTGEQGKGR